MNSALPSAAVVDRELVRCPCGGHARRYDADVVRGRSILERYLCRACRRVCDPAARTAVRVMEVTVPGRHGPVVYRACLTATGSRDDPRPRWGLSHVRGRQTGDDGYQQHETARVALLARYLPSARDWAAIGAGVEPRWATVHTALAAVSAGQAPDMDALARVVEATTAQRDADGDYTYIPTREDQAAGEAAVEIGLAVEEIVAIAVRAEELA